MNATVADPVAPSRPTFDEAWNIAEKLSKEDRALLVLRIEDSIRDHDSDNRTDIECDAAWAAEINRRVADIESGRVKGIPSDQVFAEAKRLLERS